MVSVYLRSALELAQLQAFYEPLAAAARCRAEQVADADQNRQWSCPADKGSVFSILTLPDYQIYALSGLLP
jgi:hypothetical protein